MPLNGEGRAGFPEGGEREPRGYLEEEPPGRKNKCKGPEVRWCLACLNDSTEASVAGLEGKATEVEARVVTRPRSRRALQAAVRASALSQGGGSHGSLEKSGDVIQLSFCHFLF